MMKHLVRKHLNQGNFHVKCMAPNCEYEKNNWNAFRQHFNRRHRDLIANGVLFEIGDFVEKDLAQDFLANVEEQIDESSDLVDFVALAASYVLELEAKHKICKSSINKIVETTDRLIKQVIQNAVGIANPRVDEMFVEFKTDFLRKKYFVENCFYVEPEKVLLKIDTVTRKDRAVDVQRFGYIIPLEKYLNALFMNSKMAEFLEKPPKNDGDLMFDFRDGSSWKQNKILGSSDDENLALVLYYDDIEVCNPLRASHRPHKLGMFYFVIANMPVVLRSTLSNIHLLAIAKTKYLRGNLGLLLNDFIKTVNKLRTNGIELIVNGRKQNTRGDLLVVITDSPAGFFLSGLKESVSKAFKMCRVCNATQKEAKRSFMGNEFSIRRFPMHLKRCGDMFDAYMTPPTKIFWSKTFGINSRSVFEQIHGFNFLDAMPFDPMHVLLEGQFPYIAALFLYRATVIDRRFTLAWLNEQIKSYPYSYLDKSSQPDRIFEKDLNSDSLKNTAAAHLTLAYILPHILCAKMPINCRFYGNLLSFIEIVLLCTSPIVDLDTCGQLETKIGVFYLKFQQLYPAAKIKPKAHQLVHMPRFIQMFGPPRNFWAMRMEGKHNFFKGRIIRNHINLPKSLANMHALLMSYNLTCGSGAQNMNFVYKGDEVGQGEVLNVQSVLCTMDASEEIAKEAQRVLNCTECYTCSTVTVFGHTYKPEQCALLLSFENKWPLFGMLVKIFVKDQVKHFVVKHLTTEVFNRRVNAYHVVLGGTYSIVRLENLENIWPLPLQFHDGKMFITSRYSHFCG